MNLPIDEKLQGNILTPPKRDEGPMYTKKGTLRKRRPKTKNQYFTSDTEEAILEYLKETDEKKRNEIYNERIWYAFHKLTENIIHTFKFYYTEVDTIGELQHEVTAFLLEKLHLYKQDKGKAFSYFGTIAKRYLILYNNNNYKKLKQRAEVDAVDNDQSTNDMVGIFSTGKVKIGQNRSITDPIIQKFELALQRLALNLAKNLLEHNVILIGFIDKNNVIYINPVNKSVDRKWSNDDKAIYIFERGQIDN